MLLQAEEAKQADRVSVSVSAQEHSNVPLPLRFRHFLL